MASNNRTIRQRPSIFRKTDSGVPELQDAETETQQDVKTAKQQKIKTTFHLTADDILAIDTIVSTEFKRIGNRPLRSEVVSRAIQELLKRQNV